MLSQDPQAYAYDVDTLLACSGGLTQDDDLMPKLEAMKLADIQVITSTEVAEEASPINSPPANINKKNAAKTLGAAVFEWIQAQAC